MFAAAAAAAAAAGATSETSTAAVCSTASRSPCLYDQPNSLHRTLVAYTYTIVDVIGYVTVMLSGVTRYQRASEFAR